MVHAVYQRGSAKAEAWKREGGFYKAVDPRTPNWYLEGDTPAAVLRMWHECWREASNN